VTRPQIFLGEVAAVVVLSSLFETVEKWLRRQLRGTGDEAAVEILNVLFKEITGLGFIGLLLFIATRTGSASSLAARLFNEPLAEVAEENPLAETFEDVHIMIFMLMLVLLFQAGASLWVTRQVAFRWRSYSQTRAFGSADDSLESKLVASGYLERVPNRDAPRRMDLQLRKAFSFGRGFVERLQVRQDPLHKLFMWRAIRHEFLFPRTKFNRGLDLIRQSPEYGLFSFEAYLRGRLGKTAVELVEVDTKTWVLTFALLVPVVYLCTSLEFVDVLKVQCATAWFLTFCALILTIVLEEDTYELTPKVPRDARQTLRLFSGTSSQMLRRAARLERSDQDNESGDGPSVMGRRFRPGLGDAEGKRRPFLGRPLGYYIRQQPGSEGRFPSSGGYSQILRLFYFLQAVCITSLLVVFLTHPLKDGLEIFLYVLAWLPWPVILVKLAPVLIRRLTIRNSIEGEKDIKLVQRCIQDAKEGLLRDFVRLMQIATFERRGVRQQEAWTLPGNAAWTRQQAQGMVEKGLQLFEEDLPTNEQWEIWQVFAAADADNDGRITLDDLTTMFATVICEGPFSCSSADESAENILRLVGHDADGLTWPEFKAVAMLATRDRPEHELTEDLGQFYDILDLDGNDQVSASQISEMVRELRIGLDAEDVSNLLYTRFGKAKPVVSKDEFVKWLRPFSSVHIS